MAHVFGIGVKPRNGSSTYKSCVAWCFIESHARIVSINSVTGNRGEGRCELCGKEADTFGNVFVSLETNIFWGDDAGTPLKHSGAS